MSRTSRFAFVASETSSSLVKSDVSHDDAVDELLVSYGSGLGNSSFASWNESLLELLDPSLGPESGREARRRETNGFEAGGREANGLEAGRRDANGLEAGRGAANGCKAFGAAGGRAAGGRGGSE